MSTNNSPRFFAASSTKYNNNQHRRISSTTTGSIMMTSLSNNSRNHLGTSNNISFVSYLNSIQESANYDAIDKKKNNSKVHLIMGNEAGDADSIISSLTLAYVQMLHNTHAKNEEEEDVAIVLPIVSVPREDIALRRDVMLLLDLVGITPEKLLYVNDDIISQNLLSSAETDDEHHASTTMKARTTLTLVDHNRIKSSMSHLSSYVTEIVDHHEDEKSHEQVTDNKRLIAFENGAATVASTCTLVTERLFNSTISIIDGSLGLALLGVILLDSVNMLPAAAKGTLRDEKAIQLLLQQTDWTTYCEKVIKTKHSSSSLVDATMIAKIFPNNKDTTAQGKPSCSPDRTALFNILSGAKNDPQFWSELSVTDCLRIDYKKFQVTQTSELSLVKSIGLSSVLLDMDGIIAKDHFINDLTSFVSMSDVDLFGILTIKHHDDGIPQRELLLTSSNLEVLDSFTNFLLNHPDAAFLEIVERKECMVEDGSSSDGGAHIRVFRQGNGKGSRKQVAPTLLGHAASLSSRLQRQ